MFVHLSGFSQFTDPGTTDSHRVKLTGLLLIGTFVFCKDCSVKPDIQFSCRCQSAVLSVRKLILRGAAVDSSMWAAEVGTADEQSSIDGITVIDSIAVRKMAGPK